MNTRAPIKAMFEGVWLNTSNDREVHAITKEYVDPDAQPLRREQPHPERIEMTQALYQTGEGRFFLAFWNQLVWDKVEMRNKLVDTAELINLQQAELWLKHHAAQHKLPELVLPKKEDEPTHPITVRVPKTVYQEIERDAKMGRVSGNKIASNWLLKGMSLRDWELLESPPSWATFCMPNGEPALDEFGAAKQFSSKDQQKLAECGAILLNLARQGRHDKIWSFVVRTLNRLIFIDKNQMHALCFAQWVAMCKRGTYQDVREAQGALEWQPG